MTTVLPEWMHLRVGHAGPARLVLDGQPFSLGEAVESIGDDLPPLRPVEHDMRLFQLGAIVGGVVDRNFARGQEPVASRHPADRHLAERQGQHRAVEQADHRIERPHPAQARPESASISARAARRSPRQQLGQHLGVAALPLDHREIELACRCRASRIGRSRRGRRSAESRRSPAPARRRGAPAAPRCGPAGVGGMPRRSPSDGAASHNRRSSPPGFRPRRACRGPAGRDRRWRGAASAPGSPRRSSSSSFAHIQQRDRARAIGACCAARPRSTPLAKARLDPADIGGALGDADRAARVEQVEQVARLEALVVGGQRQRLVRRARGIPPRRRRNARNSLSVSASSKL